MSAVQESRLSHRAWATSVNRESYLNNDYIAWRLVGDLDVEGLEQALAHLWSRHDTLTARYVHDRETGSWTQVLERDMLPQLRRMSFAEIGAASDEQIPHKVLAYLADIVALPVRLDTAPLIDLVLVEVRPREHILLMCYPSLMMDHWGYERFLSELALCYTAYSRGGEPDLEPCGQFSQYATAERNSLDDGDWEDSVRFWIGHYAGASPLPSLALSGLGASEAAFLEVNNLTGVLPADVAAALQVGTSKLVDDGVTPFCFLLAALLSILAEVEKDEPVGVLIPSANRMDWRYQESVGLFATILSLRFPDVAAMSFGDLCVKVREAMWDVVEHQHVSYHAMLKRLEPAKFGRPADLASFYFDYWKEQATQEPAGFGDLESHLLSIPQRHLPENENLSLVFHEAADGHVSYVFSHARRAMSDKNAGLLLEDLQRIVCVAAQDLSVPTADLVRGSALLAARLGR